jgi:choice-of-anchor C domain-containing protein
MKKRSLGGVIVAVIAAIALPVTALAGGAVGNGSFETGNFVNGGSGLEVLAAGTANAGDITGWTVTSGTVDWVSTYWTSEDGSKSLDMNGTPTSAVASTVGAISQSLATTVNNMYVIRFFLAGNPTCGPSTKNLVVRATGTAPQTYSFTNTSTTTISNMGWEAETYSFAAMGSSTTLTFAADPSNTSNCGPALDNISTTETVATGADCKHGGWRTMFETNGTPFKNQGDCVSFYASSGATPIGVLGRPAPSLSGTGSVAAGAGPGSHRPTVNAPNPQFGGGGAPASRGNGASHRAG